MSVILNQQPCEFCPDDCKQKKVCIEETSLYAGSEVYETIRTLYCEHESACRMWVDRFVGKMPSAAPNDHPPTSDSGEG